MDLQFQTLAQLHQKHWYQLLPFPQKELLQQSFHLLDEFAYQSKNFYDYSFVVMPAAKAYEGFVKDLLRYLKLISQKRYEGNLFRVGKALNPALSKANPERYEALYDDLEKLSGSPEIPQLLWNTWKDCRNEVFHYFAQKDKNITLASARSKLHQVVYTIEYTCQVFNYTPNKSLPGL
jgi:hypothetical protein